MKICQYASYNINTGDNSTVYGIREYFKQNSSLSNIEWYNFNNNQEISRIAKNSPDANSLSKAILSNFKRMKDTTGCQLLLIGGGGQIEPRPGWANEITLPFNEEILDNMGVPVACVGLGINYFRKKDPNEKVQINKIGFRNLECLINKSIYFSVRNDGSYEILKDLFKIHSGSDKVLSKVREIPDPGLFFENQLPNKNTKQIQSYVFQPSWNNSLEVRSGRGLTEQSISNVVEFIEKYKNFNLIPHSPKDYSFPEKGSRWAVTKDRFKEYVKFNQYVSFMQQIYLKHDMSVAMRGHGQLNAIAVNMPSLYFSTQDKVRDFSLKNGFGNYNIDIKEKEWQQKLDHCMNRMLNDESYLKQWYEIRNEKMLQFRQQFAECVNEITEIISNENFAK